MLKTVICAPLLNSYFYRIFAAMRKCCILLLLMVFLLPAVDAAGNVAMAIQKHEYSSYSLHSAAPLTRHEHNNILPEGIYAAPVPEISHAAGNQHTRSLPAESNPGQQSVQTYCPFIFIPLLETFGNNQRSYNHPTHHFW